MAGRLTQLKRLLATPGARRVATLAAKGTAGTLAAGAGLVLGLREAKRSLRHETPVDFWDHVALDVKRRNANAPDSSAASSACAALPALCARSGISEADFWASARRLRPVELELELLHASFLNAGSGAKQISTEERHAKEDELMSSWKERGYFDPDMLARDRSNIFGRRLTSDAQGVDIGVLVPPYLPLVGATPDAPATQPVAWSAEASNAGGQQLLREASEATLERWGCVLLRGLLSSDDVTELRTALGLGGVVGKSGQKTPAKRASEVGMWMQQHDPNVSMGRYTYGRLHILLRGSPEFEAAAVSAHASLAPLVHRHFKAKAEVGHQVFLSEAQLIITDPCAEVQQFHVDSVGGRGFSVFVPLADVPLNRGPQQVLPGTHHLHDPQLPFLQGLGRCLTALCATHGAVSPATGSAVAAGTKQQAWGAGDALVLDSGTLHRGLGNDSLGAPIPILVLRYDTTDKPPPGCRRSWLLMMTRLGSALNSLFRLYAYV